MRSKMSKKFRSALVPVLTLIIGVVIGGASGWLKAYSTTSQETISSLPFDVYYDANICAALRQGDSDAALRKLEARMGGKLHGLAFHAQRLSLNLQPQDKALRQIHTYIAFYPDRFNDVTQLPEVKGLLAKHPSLTSKELSEPRCNSAICILMKTKLKP
jgi:hypothetical protein